jgi:hypothetical protein
MTTKYVWRILRVYLHLKRLYNKYALRLMLKKAKQFK